MREFVIDLFCGAGGTSEGVHLADCDSQVTACVNHDLKAIESHRRNHPNAKHFVEDIRNPEVVFFLKLRVEALRKLHPDCIITIWASLECTNFSKAKGGLSRKADSRTLANHLFMYLDALNPDYLMIENVREFLDWGPLRLKEGKGSTREQCELQIDKKGEYVKIPDRSRLKEYYNEWRDSVRSYGYNYEYRLLNAADFGAYTSRLRYFAQFALGNLPIVWPERTHCKNPEKENKHRLEPLKKWRAVKAVLDFEVEGKSIFNRKKPLVENTLKRIYAGLVKFVANGDDSFIKKYFSGKPEGKVISLNGPAGTVTTIDHQTLVSCNFILKYNSTNKNGKHVPPSIEEPCPTVAAQNRLGLTNVSFLQRSNGGNPKDRVNSVESPSITITTSPNNSLVDVSFLQGYYGAGNTYSVDEPCPTISTRDRFGKVDYLMMNGGTGNNENSTAEKTDSFLFNPQYNNPGNSLENPSPVIIARQDKRPISLVVCSKGESFMVPIYEDDTETMVKIKQFMAVYGITDIKMRMLLVEELLRIQGFPKGYELVGTQTDKKKFIGNSVEVTTAKKLFEAHFIAVREYKEQLKQVA